MPATNLFLPAPAPALLSPLTTLSDADLEDRITTLAAHIHAATYRFLVLVAELDRRGWDYGSGITSTAHWLNWKCGISVGAAREKVRVARALPGLPQISAAFERGELSFSKVRAISRVASVEDEDYYLYIARAGTAAHVERLVSACRRSGSDRDAERATANERHLRREAVGYFDSDGQFVLRARLDAETGRRLMLALDAAAAEMRTDVSAETPDEPPAARRADALALLADTFLAHGPAEGGNTASREVVVHVDAAVLADEQRGDRCGIEHEPEMALDTVRRMACDAGIVIMAEGTGGEPLNVGRRTRSIPPALRRALQSRDHGCRFPGCTHHKYVDGHHIVHWADGGETKLSNLVMLCRHHHHLLHEGGFGLRRVDDGALVFTRPDGTRLSEAPALPSPDDAPVQDIAVDARTCVPGWHGESMDIEMALAALRERHAPGCC